MKTAKDAVIANHYGRAIANDSEGVNALITSGLDSKQGTESRAIAEQLAAKIMDGGKVTVTEVANLVRANETAMASENANVSDNSLYPHISNRETESALTPQQSAPANTPHTPPITEPVNSGFDESMATHNQNMTAVDAQIQAGNDLIAKMGGNTVLPPVQNVAPPVQNSANNLPVLTKLVPGKTGNAYTNDNRKIDFTYALVPADNLITSNNSDGSVNPHYPQELQPRDRTRISSNSQIQKIAMNLVPEKLAESASISDGAPIISPDGIVESGNGRVAAIKLAYNKGVAAKYREFIVNNAEKFGLDADKIPPNAVLVRIRNTPVDRMEFVRNANESTVASKNSTENAKIDSGRLNDNILSLFYANEHGQINSPDNKNFITAVIKHVFPEGEINNLVNSSRSLSQAGLERIKNAIFYKAYGDTSLLEQMSESLDSDIKNVINILINVAPGLVKLKSNIASNNAYNVDFSADIADGVRLFSELKGNGNTLVEYINQGKLYDPFSNEAKEFASIFERKNRGAKQATEILNSIINAVYELGNPMQNTFVNDTTDVSKGRVLNDGIQRYNQQNEQHPNKQYTRSEWSDKVGLHPVPNGTNETANQHNGLENPTADGRKTEPVDKPDEPKSNSVATATTPNDNHVLTNADNDTIIRDERSDLDAYGIAKNESVGSISGQDAGMAAHDTGGKTNNKESQSANRGSVEPVIKTTSSGITLEYSEFPKKQYSSEQNNIAEMNKELGFETVFFIDQLSCFDKSGNIFRIVTDGTYDGGIIYINTNSKEPFLRIALHESVHGIERNNYTEFDNLWQNILRTFDAGKLNEELNSYYLQLKEHYTEAEIKGHTQSDIAMREILANLAWQLKDPNSVPSYITNTEAAKAAFERFFNARKAEVAGEKLPGKDKEDVRYSVDNSEKISGGGDKSNIIKNTNNKPIVDISEDILKGVPKKLWVRATVAKLKKKFPMGVIVNKQQIFIDAQSRGEITHSGYSEYLRRNKNSLFADKLRAANNADEIVKATVNWVNEAPKHTRKDNITGFAKGQVNLRVLGNDYTADVIVAIAKNGKAKLYDILDITPTKHIVKASLTVDSTSIDEFYEGQEKLSTDSIHQDGEIVNSNMPENEKNDARHSFDTSGNKKTSVKKSIDNTEEITVLPGSASKSDAINFLMSIAGKPLKNDATGIVAYINSEQRRKIMSEAAVNKTARNGFTFSEHNSAVKGISELFKKAVVSDRHSDKDGNANLNIIRFTAPVKFDLGDNRG